MVSVSTSAMKMLAKDTAVFVPIAVPCGLHLEMEKKLSFKISGQSSGVCFHLHRSEKV